MYFENVSEMPFFPKQPNSDIFINTLNAKLFSIICLIFSTITGRIQDSHSFIVALLRQIVLLGSNQEVK